MSDDRERMQERYARRPVVDPRYSLLNPAALLALQERQRAIGRLLVRAGIDDATSPDLIEVGCGTGGNLLDALRVGFAPDHLSGIELLPDRYAVARRCLPELVRLTQGDASEELEPASADIVMQMTVFSSLLDDTFQQRLADAMWRALRPGGAVLWYDFTLNNPRNPDVRGVPLKRVRQLFRNGELTHERLTLAPPLARPVVALHPSLYTLFNLVPLLRTHLLCWIRKPIR